MAKSRKPRTKATRSQSRTPAFESIPLTGITPAEEALALKFDELVTSNKVTDRQIKAMQPGDHPRKSSRWLRERRKAADRLWPGRRAGLARCALHPSRSASLEQAEGT